MQNVRSSHLLDGALFDLKGLKLGDVVTAGDTAFDD